MTDLKQLHETDFNLWIEEMKTAIANRDLEAMDWDNLLDEIDDMGKSDKRAIDSYMQRLIEHILKLKYWDNELERCRKGWMKEVINFRNRIKRLLKNSPSLKNHLESEFSDNLRDAIAVMKFEFDIPEDASIDVNEIMKDNYFG